MLILTAIDLGDAHQESSVGIHERPKEKDFWAVLPPIDGRPQFYVEPDDFNAISVIDTDRNLLEQAVNLGWGDRAWMENDSDLDLLHADPRFQALLARIH